MKTRFSLGMLFLLLGFSALGPWSGSAFAAEPPGASPAGVRALNLARTALGARLLTADLPGGVPADGAPRIAQALLSDDDPLGCELPAGTTSLVLALPRTEILHRFDFLNLTAGGQVSVAGSNVRLPAGSPRWRTLSGVQDFATPNEVVSCELGTAEVRYVRVSFQLSKAGRIDTLGLFGEAIKAQLVAERSRQVGGRYFVGYETLDYGNVAAHARVAKTSSGGGTGEAADRMIDGSLRTGYRFEVSDRRPTAVIDLGSNRSLTRVSVAFHAGPGRLEFYLTPEPAAYSRIVRRNPSYAGQSAEIPQVGVESASAPAGTPVATLQSDGRPGLRRASLSLEGQSGRYLAVVFIPERNNQFGGVSPASSARHVAADYKDYKDAAPDYKDFKDAPAAAYGDSGDPGDPFFLSEVAAFGPPMGSDTALYQLPPAGTSTPGSLPPGGVVVVTP